MAALFRDGVMYGGYNGTQYASIKTKHTQIVQNNIVCKFDFLLMHVMTLLTDNKCS